MSQARHHNNTTFGIYMPYASLELINNIHKKVPRNLFLAYKHCVCLIKFFLNCTYTKDLYSRSLQALLVEELNISNSVLCLIYKDDVVGQESLCRILSEDYMKIKIVLNHKNDKGFKNNFFLKMDKGSMRSKSTNHFNYVVFKYLCNETHSNIANIFFNDVTENGISKINDNKDTCTSLSIISVCAIIMFISNSFCTMYENKIINADRSVNKLLHKLYILMVALSLVAHNTKKDEQNKWK